MNSMTRSREQRSPIAAIVAGIALLGAGPLHAADAPTVESLQAEVARLKAELAARDAQQASQPVAPPATAPITAPSSDAKPEQAAKAEPATAEPQELEKVVVRSRNRLERVQDVPLSVSVIGGKELERELAFDIGAITKRASNVVRNTGNSRTFSLSIRGVGKVSQAESQDTSVGVNVDGVSYAYAPLASFDFYDVESVEVARGPQGTLLGKNATMGLINVTTRRPSFTPDANWSLTFGQRHTVVSQMAGGGPVIDDLLAWRGALTVDKGEGAFKNRYNPDQTYYDRDRVSGRVKFLLTPNPDFSALATLEVQPKGAEYYNGQTVYKPLPATYSNGSSTTGKAIDIRSKLNRRWFTAPLGGVSYYDTSYLGNTSPNLDNQRPLETSTNGTSLELKWNLGNFDLTSISAYRDYHFHARNDEGTPFDVSKNGGGKNDKYSQVSEELRLSSKPGGFVDYQTGVILFTNRVAFGQQGWNAGWGSDAGAWFANDTTAKPEYSLLDADANGRELMRDSLNGMNKTSTQNIKNKSIAVFGQADWHLAESVTLTTGARITRENRTNVTSSQIADSGFGGALNPSSINGVILGGFDAYLASTDAKTYVINNVVVAKNTPGATVLDRAYVSNGVAVPIGTNISTASATPGASDITIVQRGQAVITTQTAGYAAALAKADAAASKYFGNGATWGSLTDSQRAQIGAAQAIRRGQIGTLWNYTNAPAFRKNQPSFVISPSYKINDNHTTYFTVQYGEKGGVAQVVNGIPLNAKPEKVTSIEWGLKSAWLNKTLFINADIFKTQVRDYQQVVTIPDPLAPTTPVNYTGNAAKVGIHGLEIDGSYTGIRNTTVRFSGAYTQARFDKFDNAPQPVEGLYTDAPVSRDISGQYLPGAARYTFNVGAEYRVPVFADQLFHTSFNTAFTSGFNGDNNLSSYGWIKKSTRTDASIGLGRRDQRFDASLIIKNLFNDKTPQTVTWTTEVPADPRWFGVQFAGKF